MILGSHSSGKQPAAGAKIRPGRAAAKARLTASSRPTAVGGAVRRRAGELPRLQADRLVGRVPRRKLELFRAPRSSSKTSMARVHCAFWLSLKDWVNFAKRTDPTTRAIDQRGGVSFVVPQRLISDCPGAGASGFALAVAARHSACPREPVLTLHPPRLGPPANSEGRR